jgi:hypothetical protein
MSLRARLARPRLSPALLALLALLTPRPSDAVWTPHANMTAPFVLSEITKCAPITHHLHACLAFACTLEPSRFSELLQRDEQSVSENYCMHQALDRITEGARRFGAEPCVASAVNASADVPTLFLLIEAASWGVSMPNELADPNLDWDLRNYEDEEQRAVGQAGLRHTLQLIHALVAAQPEHAALRTAAEAWEADVQVYFKPWTMTLRCKRGSDGEIRPCEELIDDEDELERAREESLREIKAQDAHYRERQAARRKEMAKGQHGSSARSAFEL